MKKRCSVIAGLLCLALAFSGCAKTPGTDKPSGNGTTNTKDAAQYKLDVLRPVAYSSIDGLNLEPGSTISIIGRYSDDSYWKEVENGAKKAVADINKMLGYKGDDKVELSYIAPNVRDDVNEQISLLDEELARYPIAIGISAIDATACQIQFDLAAENGIPIVTFDSGSEYQHIASHVSTDNLDATATAASKLANALDGQGEVAVFVQDSFSMTAKQRLQGFMDTISKRYPQISVVNVYHMDQLSSMQQTIAAEKNAALAEGESAINPEELTQKDVVKYVIEKYPNLKGIYSTNLDSTQLVAGVLKDLKKTDLTFIGFDGGTEQMKLLESGLLEGIIIQNPYAMGYATVVAAARVSLSLPNESFVNSGYTWVTKDNMKKEDIKGMLY